MSPSGPFYCLFRWDLSQLDSLEPTASGDVQIRDALENEYSRVARVWHDGLAKEPGEPWADYLKRWSSDSATRWFLDARKRLSARILVGDENGEIVGISGIVPEKRSGIGRMFTGVVVASDKRNRGVGALLLYKTLEEAKRERLHFAEVETLADIIASRYLYHKFNGKQTIIPR